MAQKQKLSNIVLHRSEPAAKVVMFAAVGVMMFLPLPLLANDAEYENQIRTAETVISSYKQEQVRLGKQAERLEVRLANLDQQLATINEQIQKNKRKFQRLSDKLAGLEAEASAQSDKVESTLREAYFDSQISLVEMLASRNSLSHYMDYYEARDRLQAQMVEDLEELKTAKAKVAEQRDEIAAVLKEGKTMKKSLQHTRSEQQDLLERTRNQQDIYAQLVKQRNSHIAELRAEQLDANQSYFVSGEMVASSRNGGGYPDKLANAPQDSLVDPWGMYNRECVSYTAWKVHQTFGEMPYWGGHGNANQWPASARADDIPTGDTPKKHAVAIAFIGPYGHSMFVEEVLKNGKIRVSEYNYFVNGTYTERIIPADGLTYIYFSESD